MCCSLVLRDCPNRVPHFDAPLEIRRLHMHNLSRLAALAEGVADACFRGGKHNKRVPVSGTAIAPTAGVDKLFIRFELLRALHLKYARARRGYHSNGLGTPSRMILERECPDTFSCVLLTLGAPH